LEGRAFNTTDDKSAPQVALVSQAMAHALWPNQDPLGRRFKFGRNGPLLQVVGVTADEKHIFINEDPRLFFYRPLAQLYEPFAAIELFTAGDAASLTSGFTEAVHEVDPDLPLYDVTTMESHLSNGLAFFFVRAGAIFAAIFGLLALILATVGIYGVVSYSVSRRAHEIGIRMALGASRGQVLSMIFRQGFLIVGIALVLGLGMATAAAKAISSLLFGVHGFDPLTFVTVSIMLSTIAALAIYIPAFRAARTQPSSALRYE
ncbi:MAG: FtsX-like permease family protein, partial [Blastocatellia bacterium]